jgi:hypothetical protein
MNRSTRMRAGSASGSAGIPARNEAVPSDVAKQADKNVRAPVAGDVASGSAGIPARNEAVQSDVAKQADKNVRAPDGNVDSPKVKRLLQRRIYETVARKRYWAGPPEPAEAAVEEAIGSRGWTTRGYLPHYDKPGTQQMVTFPLADAMPASRQHEWQALFAIADDRVRRTRLEAYLNRGYGDCLLRQAAVAAAVEGVLLRFDGRRY